MFPGAAYLPHQVFSEVSRLVCLILWNPWISLIVPICSFSRLEESWAVVLLYPSPVSSYSRSRFSLSGVQQGIYCFLTPLGICFIAPGSISLVNLTMFAWFGWIRVHVFSMCSCKPPILPYVNSILVLGGSLWLVYRCLSLSYKNKSTDSVYSAGQKWIKY